MHIRKTTITSHLPALPWDLLEAQHSRARSWHLSWTAGCWVSFGRLSHILRPQPRKRATRVNQGQAQGPTLLLQLESLLSPQLPLLDLLLVKPSKETSQTQAHPLCGRGQQCSHQGL